MAKPTATAASTALPPRLSTSAPMSAARPSCATTMPCWAVTDWTGGNCRARCACAAAGATVRSRTARKARRLIPLMGRTYLKRCGSETAGFVEERLHRLEQLHAVLFHHDRMRAFGQHDETLAGRVDEQREQGLSHIGRRIAIPFGD